ncbi:MAG: helix-turn-helix domain-containing protein [Verrucomicrobiota bacterium]
MIQSLSHDDPAAMEREARSVVEATAHGSELPHCHVPVKDYRARLTRGTQVHELPEIFFQFSGTNEFHCGQQRFTLKPGEICIMPAGVPHSEIGDGDNFSAMVIVHDPNRFLILAMKCEPGRAPWAVPTTTCEISNGQQLTDLLSEAAASKLRNSPAAPHLLRGYLGMVLESIDRPIPASDRHYSPLVAQCMDLLFAEASSTDLTLNQVAQRLNCNADSLSARFSREVGKTAIEYLTERRIAKASRLLLNGYLQVAEVAWACGYRDPNYFSRLFKKQMGSTPIDFKKQHRNR